MASDSSRREFLTGRSALRALADAHDKLAEPLPAPARAETWLTQFSRNAMAWMVSADHPLSGTATLRGPMRESGGTYPQIFGRLGAGQKISTLRSITLVAGLTRYLGNDGHRARLASGKKAQAPESDCQRFLMTRW